MATSPASVPVSAVSQSTATTSPPTKVAKPIEAAKTVQPTPVPVVAAIPVVPVAVAPAPSTPPVTEVKTPAPTAVAVEVKTNITISDADGLALAKKRNCLACHMIDKKVVGPAWKDVAAKYRGDAGAQARMEAKIGKGGSGAWGSMAMPPQPQVTAEERALLARFILNLK
ncbi:MAG: c-type cytochrome [Sideroxydans sp.]